MTGRHLRIRASLLVLLLLGGTMGAPLIGPLRESLQTLLGVSRAQFGEAVFVLGLAAGLASLGLVVRFQRTLSRPTFIRWGTLALLAGMVLFVLVRPAPGPAVAGLAVGWFLLTMGNVARGIAGPVVMDLWRESPHTGVILLHGVNAFGKVLAPLLVVLVGQELRVNAAVYSGALALLMLDMLTWPRRSVRTLVEIERAQQETPEDRQRTWRGGLFWAAAVQFGFIAGSEAGVVSILGSFVQQLRPSPWPGLENSRWAALVLIVMQLGIVVGRFVFVGTPRLRERTIIIVCLLCGLFAVPGALGVSPWVYLPSLFVLGGTFSATYPAFFALSARSFVAHRTAYSLAVGLASQVGINLCMWFSSAVGNRDAFLPAAVLASTAVIGLFALFLFATPPGRTLVRNADAVRRREGC